MEHKDKQDNIQNSTDNPLGVMPVGRLLTRFAVPSIIAMLVSALYNIVDQFFIGRSVGNLGNAATNIAFPLSITCIAISLLFGIGGASAFNLSTGAVYNAEQLKEWVDYALENSAVILFDSAYEAFISDETLPRSIFAIEGAKKCAIEFCSLSKTAGFTGTRLAFTVVPMDLKCKGVSLNSLWARRHGTKFNGVPYIIQRAGEAVYTEDGQRQTKDQVAYYMKNAKVIYNGLKEAGYTVSGGVNAPYIWLKTPNKMSSWEFFDYLLDKANVVGTPGSGFGPSGEGYFRLTSFGSYENTVRAMERIRTL